MSMTYCSSFDYIRYCTSIQTLASDAFNGLENGGLLKLAYLDLIELAPFTFRGLNAVRQLTIENSDLGRTINSTNLRCFDKRNFAQII